MTTKQNPPDITEENKENYKTLLMAAMAGRLGLMSGLEKGTGKPIMVLVGKNMRPDGEFDLVPLGTLFTSDPTEFIETPDGFSANSSNSNSLDDTSTLAE